MLAKSLATEYMSLPAKCPHPIFNQRLMDPLDGGLQEYELTH